MEPGARDALLEAAQRRAAREPAPRPSPVRSGADAGETAASLGLQAFVAAFEVAIFPSGYSPLDLAPVRDTTLENYREAMKRRYLVLIRDEGRSELPRGAAFLKWMTETDHRGEVFLPQEGTRGLYHLERAYGRLRLAVDGDIFRRGPPHLVEFLEAFREALCPMGDRRVGLAPIAKKTLRLYSGAVKTHYDTVTARHKPAPPPGAAFLGGAVQNLDLLSSSGSWSRLARAAYTRIRRIEQHALARAPPPPPVRPAKQDETPSPVTHAEARAPAEFRSQVALPPPGAPQYDAARYDAPHYDAPHYDAPQYDASRHEAHQRFQIVRGPPSSRAAMNEDALLLLEHQRRILSGMQAFSAAQRGEGHNHLTPAMSSAFHAPPAVLLSESHVSLTDAVRIYREGHNRANRPMSPQTYGRAWSGAEGYTPERWAAMHAHHAMKNVADARQAEQHYAAAHLAQQQRLDAVYGASVRAVTEPPSDDEDDEGSIQSFDALPAGPDNANARSWALGDAAMLAGMLRDHGAAVQRWGDRAGLDTGAGRPGSYSAPRDARPYPSKRRRRS